MYCFKCENEITNGTVCDKCGYDNKENNGFLFSTTVELKAAVKVVKPLDYEDENFVISEGILQEYKGDAGFADIPEGVTGIGYEAFKGRKSLLGVKIPSTVTDIALYAFEDCENLLVIGIPDSVESIGARAFVGCKSLKEIILPDKAVKIGHAVFDDTEFFRNTSNWSDNCLYIGNHFIKADDSIAGKYTIKQGTLTIADDAFENCNRLTHISVPQSVEKICDGFCSGCESLEAILYDGNNFTVENGVLFNKDKTKILCYPIGKKAESYIIPAGVRYISEKTFMKSRHLKKVTIPDSVLEIGFWAFRDCVGLENAIIPGSVQEIAGCAFENCYNLKSVHIFDGVKKIGWNAFENCHKLESITIPDSVEEIGTDICRDTAFYENKKNWQGGILYIGNQLVAVDQSIEGECHIKPGTKTIAEYAFYKFGSYFEYLTSIVIPDSVKTIGRNAFGSCINLRKAKIGKGVERIGWGAFRECISLNDINIHDGVKGIDSSVFNDTQFYKDENNWRDGVLYIGNHLIKAEDRLEGRYYIRAGTKTIAAAAFYGCKKLTRINIPDSIAEIGEGAFQKTGIYDNNNYWSEGALYIGKYLVDTYRTIEGEFAVKDGTKYISPNAFCNCRKLTSVRIPDSVSYIGYEAFAECKNLEKVSYPETAVLGDAVFWHCRKLKPENIEIRKVEKDSQRKEQIYRLASAIKILQTKIEECGNAVMASSADLKLTENDIPQDVLAIIMQVKGMKDKLQELNEASAEKDAEIEKLQEQLKNQKQRNAAELDGLIQTKKEREAQVEKLQKDLSDYEATKKMIADILGNG